MGCSGDRGAKGVPKKSRKSPFGGHFSDPCSASFFHRFFTSFLTDFNDFFVSIFNVFYVFFENVGKYEIELWLPPGLDFKDSVPQKSQIFQ